VKTLGSIRSATLVAAALLLVAARGGASSLPTSSADLVATLARAGERVAAFFSRAQSLVCTELVSIQSLSHGLTPEGFSRVVESELRLWWETSDGPPATTAQTRRQVVRVNKRPPRQDDPKNCTKEEQQETESQPLSMLLPEQRLDYEFKLAGTGRVEERAAIMIDFRHLAPVSVDIRAIDDNQDCIGYALNGGMRGRLWFDRETLDVLRLDQRLTGMVDMRLPKLLARRPGAESHWTLERWDTSIRFGAVTFRDPDESLVLPLSSTTLRVTRGAGSPRVRTETKYANYKRFLTGGRVVGDAYE
jgi:hypothetical protein